MVIVQTSVILPVSLKPESSLTAHLAGSVLYEEKETLRLDARSSMFPAEALDFGETLWAPADAGWQLSWNPLALEQPFLGSVRLLVNSRHSRVSGAVGSSAPTPEDKAIQETIYFDVARSLILGALAEDEFIERGGQYPEGSCGRAIYSLIQLLFPGDPLLGLKGAAIQHPEHFGAELQARLRSFLY
jgi:hypothetical protein